MEVGKLIRGSHGVCISSSLFCKEVTEWVEEVGVTDTQIILSKTHHSTIKRHQKKTSLFTSFILNRSFNPTTLLFLYFVHRNRNLFNVLSSTFSIHLFYQVVDCSDFEQQLPNFL